MELSKIDLSGLVAISHGDDHLGLVIDRGDRLDVFEVPAPYAAYEGLQQLSQLIAYTDGAYPIDLNHLPENRSTLPGATKSSIPMYSVQSHIANAIGYDVDRNLLRVEFKNGAVYQYQDVEPEIYGALQEADSVGRFFNQEIKGRYLCDRG